MRYAWYDAEAATGAPTPEPPANLTPLPGSQDCVGRRVLVPRHVWPDYSCDENDERGWTAHIVGYSRGAATIRFAHATDERGLPYPDERLQIGALAPI